MEWKKKGNTKEQISNLYLLILNRNCSNTLQSIIQGLSRLDNTQKLESNFSDRGINNSTSKRDNNNNNNNEIATETASTTINWLVTELLLLLLLLPIHTLSSHFHTVRIPVYPFIHNMPSMSIVLPSISIKERSPFSRGQKIRHPRSNNNTSNNNNHIHHHNTEEERHTVLAAA